MFLTTTTALGRVILVVAVVLTIATPLAWSQSQEAPTSAELNLRLQRVERVLDNRVLLDMLQRIESVLSEVRQLRGEVERLDFEMKSMNKKQRDLYLDIDRRLQTLESGNTNTMGGMSLEELSNYGTVDGNTVDDIQADPIENAGDILSGEGGAAAVSVRSTPKPGEKAQYGKAYDILMAGNNSDAIQAFSVFLADYPDGPYSDNAWYWQGEANYVLRDFTAALKSFEAVLKQYPDSVKVPDAKLKIAFALYEQNKFEESRGVLDSVAKDYPGTSAARLAKKRLQAMSAEGN